MGANEELPAWANWLQAIGPTMVGIAMALVAVVIGVVACRHWQAWQRDRLKLDLFHFRYKVYEELMRIAMDVPDALRQSTPDPAVVLIEKIDGLRYAAVRADMLFASDVTQHIRKIEDLVFQARKIAADPIYRKADIDVDDFYGSDEFAKWDSTLGAFTVELDQTSRELSAAMKPYLDMNGAK